MDISKLEERVKLLEHSLGQKLERNPDQRLASNAWLSSIAIICFILAAGLLIKVSIDSGWLTPERQMGLAALIGLGLAGAGLAFGTSSNPHVNLLPGAGINVLFLTSFAAHRLYALIPSEIAVAVTSIFSGVCLWLYTELEHDIYAVTAALGAYVIPIVFGYSFETSFTVTYFVMCSLAFSAISVWMKSRMLTMISAYLAILSTSYVGLKTSADLLIAIILAIHFLVFSIGTYLYTARTNSPLTEREGWSFLPVLLIFYSMEFYFIDRIHPGLSSPVAVLSAFVLLGLYLYAKKQFPDRSLGSQSVILTFLSLTLIHAVYIEIVPSVIRPWILPILFLVFAFRSSIRIPTLEFKGPLRIPIIAFGIALTAEYIGIAFRLFADLGNHQDKVVFPLGIACAIGLWLSLMVGFKNAERLLSRWRYFFFAGAHLLATLLLARIVPPNILWLAWLCYGLGIIAYAKATTDSIAMKSAWFVVILSAGKFLLIDARLVFDF
ncbi:MAG: DUF2339 domain-containing protein [Deltaproteobacteria bacterium]|jgi:hypothetical protein|nr:DUF2339 domain-containing protein [Deltaproteobacteria bacterium]